MPEESKQQLRSQAEERLRQAEAEAGAPEQLTPEKNREVLHELRVRQIELEMQNEELRRIRHQLETSQGRYVDLYNLAPVGYLTLDDQGIIQEVNLTCANLLGVTRGELVNQPLSRFIFSEDQELYYHHCRQLVEIKAAQSCELRMVQPDGSLFWAQLQGVCPWEGEDASGYLVVMHDCSRRKLAENEVRQAKEQWEKTFDAIDDVVTMHDRNMRVIQANKAAATLLDMAPRELAGKYCYQVFRQAEEPCSGCPEVLARLTETPCRANIHHERLHKTFTVVSYPLIEPTGLSGFVCVAKDITESLQMEARLRQLHKMEAVGVLAGGIAHDFNNILFPILGYAELADLKVSPDDPVTSSYLQKIIQGALRAKDMTSQLLSFSQQLPTKKYSFRPHLVVKEALGVLQTSLPENVAMEAEIYQDCGTILADPTQYYQVVMNLCTNALQAMGATGGVLRVCLKREAIGEGDGRISDAGLVPGDYIVLGVSDTGCGMESGAMKRIFDPYFTTRETGKGSGLGLSVVHGIVKNYRGGITVESEPGKGTSFSVYFPGVADKPVKVKEALPVAPLPGLERIVVVDDETMITSLFQAILNKFGYQSSLFNDNNEALDFITQQPEAIDLLITDMTMPQLNGLDLSLKARAIRPDLPIILCTGYSDLVSEERTQELGINVFLMKPFSIDDLFSAMRKALEKVEG